MAETLTAIEVNCETGEVIERPLTKEEIADREKMSKAWAEEQAKREAEAQALADTKASALAKLAALGLTEEEAAAIAG